MTMETFAYSPRLLDAACRTDFETFIGKTFQYLCPGAKYLPNWHVEALAFHLEQVRCGKIRRLIINMPPRSLKSLVTSVAFPAYLLGQDPTKHIIAVSYASDLAIKHANDFRVILNAPWYQRTFRETQISSLKNTEFEVATTRHGYRLATSVDGTLTGRGGDIIIVDDPIKPIDALSDVKRERVNDWFKNTLISRLDDKEKGAIIVVMQRLHMDDLTGMLLSNSDEWTLLNLPAIATHEEKIEIGRGRYHIRTEGDVLHPERESEATLSRLREQLGAETFTAQYQQNPTPPGGFMVKREWLSRYSDLPARETSEILISWDTADKSGSQNDWSVGTTWQIHNHIYYLIDVLRGRFDYPELRTHAIANAILYKPGTILVEEHGVGIGLIPELRDAGFSVIGVRPELDKKARMAVQCGKFESGRVLLPEDAPWLDNLVAELTAFPNVRYDDQVDSVSQALAHELSGYCWNAETNKGYERFLRGLMGWPYK